MPGNLQLRPQQIESVTDPYVAIANTGEHEVPEVAPGPVDDVQRDPKQSAEVPVSTSGAEVDNNVAALLPSPPIPDQSVNGRPRRERQPNTKYSSDIYDLSQIGLKEHRGYRDGCVTSKLFRPWE